MFCLLWEFLPPFLTMATGIVYAALSFLWAALLWLGLTMFSHGWSFLLLFSMDLKTTILTLTIKVICFFSNEDLSGMIVDVFAWVALFGHTGNHWKNKYSLSVALLNCSATIRSSKILASVLNCIILKLVCLSVKNLAYTLKVCNMWH